MTSSFQIAAKSINNNKKTTTITNFATKEIKQEELNKTKHQITITKFLTSPSPTSYNNPMHIDNDSDKEEKITFSTGDSKNNNSKIHIFQSYMNISI